MTQFIWVGLAAFAAAGAVSAALGGPWRRSTGLASVVFLLAALGLAAAVPDEPPFGCSDRGSAVAAAQVTCSMLAAAGAGAMFGASVRARAAATIVLAVLLGAAALVVVWAPYVCSLAT